MMISNWKKTLVLMVYLMNLIQMFDVIRCMPISSTQY